MLPIITERLILRPVTEQDVTPPYIEALNDPEVVRLTEARHVRWDRERVLQWVRQSNVEGVSLFVGIFLKGSGRHIGNMRLFNFHPVYRRAELSFIIFDRTQWGKGYGTEAVRALTDAALDTLKLHRVHADYYATNHASARLFAKAGFRIEGVFKDHVLVNGRFLDSIRVARMAEATGERTARDGRGDVMSGRRTVPSAGPSITEAEVQLVAEAARLGWYEHMRRYLDEFEQAFASYTGMRYCLATHTCTAAIHLALLALRVGRGDEVIVPDVTWVASAAPICYVGARPVFADIEPDTWCLSPASLERRITRRTKAIVAVGLYGGMPAMDMIRAIADRRGIPVIEDAAESLGAAYKGRKAGTWGTIGVFSFTGTKLMVTGEGGMFVTNERRLYERARRLAQHGMEQGPQAKRFWSYELGVKTAMTNLQAALGLAQLGRLEELIEQRRRLFRWYQQRLEAIDGLQLNAEPPGVRNTFWVVTAIVSRRYGMRKERLLEAFRQHRIDCRPFFYPLSSMPPFKPYCGDQPMRRVNPVAYRIAPYGISLPSASIVTEADVDFVCGVFRKILSGSEGGGRSAAGRSARVPLEAAR